MEDIAIVYIVTVAVLSTLTSSYLLHAPIRIRVVFASHYRRPRKMVVCRPQTVDVVAKCHRLASLTTLRSGKLLGLHELKYLMV